MKKEWLFRLVLIAISSSFTLIAVEAGYRFFLNEQHQFSVSPTGNQYKFYQFDPQLGEELLYAEDGDLSYAQTKLKTASNVIGTTAIICL